MLKVFEDILLFEGITVAMVVTAALAKMEQVGVDMEQEARRDKSHRLRTRLRHGSGEK